MLLLVGHDDAVMDTSFDQLFENPQKMVRRHRNISAQATELGGDSTVGLARATRQAYDEVTSVRPHTPTDRLFLTPDEVSVLQLSSAALHDVPGELRRARDMMRMLPSQRPTVQR